MLIVQLIHAHHLEQSDIRVISSNPVHFEGSSLQRGHVDHISVLIVINQDHVAIRQWESLFCEASTKVGKTDHLSSMDSMELVVRIRNFNLLL